MKIAVTYENGQVFQHFGHTEQFKLYDIQDGKVINSKVIGTNGQGHEALAGLLGEDQIDVLICGGIGMGAQMALAEVGIKLFAGISGSADEAVEKLINGTLEYDLEPHCSGHGEGTGHNCGQGSCGHHCH